MAKAVASKKAKKEGMTLPQTIAYILVVGGAIGFIAAFVLTLEKFALLKNPNYNPSCNISPLISCGSVMKTWQASAFGFANSLLGVAGFAVVITTGVAMLAGATFKRWYWRGLELGTIFGIGFVTWLASQSIFVIKALCPYCMVVWVAMIPIFIYTTLYNLRVGNIPTPARLKGLVAWAQRHHGDILISWYLVIILIILREFWSYWQTLL